jgi:hypothetical protein
MQFCTKMAGGNNSAGMFKHLSSPLIYLKTKLPQACAWDSGDDDAIFLRHLKIKNKVAAVSGIGLKARYNQVQCSDARPGSWAMGSCPHKGLQHAQRVPMLCRPYSFTC